MHIGWVSWVGILTEWFCVLFCLMHIYSAILKCCVYVGCIFVVCPIPLLWMQSNKKSSKTDFTLHILCFGDKYNACVKVFLVHNTHKVVRCDTMRCCVTVVRDAATSLIVLRWLERSSILAMCYNDSQVNMEFTGCQKDHFLHHRSLVSGAYRAHEAGEGACNFVNGKIQTWRRVLKLVISI